MRPDENQKLQIRFGSKSHRRHREPRGGYAMIDKSYDYFSGFINIKFILRNIFKEVHSLNLCYRKDTTMIALSFIDTRNVSGYNLIV